MSLNIVNKSTQSILACSISACAFCNPLDEAIHNGLKTSDISRYSITNQNITLGGLDEDIFKTSFQSSRDENFSGRRFSLIPGTTYTAPGGYPAIKELVNVIESIDSTIAPEIYWLQNVLPYGHIDYKRNTYSPEVKGKDRQHLGNFTYGVTGSYLGLNKKTLDFGAGAFTIIRYIFSDKKLGWLQSPWGGLNSDAKGDEPTDYIYSNLGQKYIESGQHIHDYFLVKKIEIQKKIDRYYHTNMADMLILEYESKKKYAIEIEEQIFDNYIPAHNSRAQKVRVIQDAKSREEQGPELNDSGDIFNFTPH